MLESDGKARDVADAQLDAHVAQTYGIFAGPAKARAVIDRFVLLRLYASPGGRDGAIAHVREVLGAAPEALSVTFGTPADASAKKWDVAVVIRCADLDALAALLARPEVVHLFHDWLPARAEVIKAWSFEVT